MARRPNITRYRPGAAVAALVFPALCAALPAAESDAGAVTVFARGTGNHHTYRIPAIVRTAKGTLLAFCEGRNDGAGDSGDIDLLVKRSTDLGRTWSEAIVVWNDGPNTCGNPAPVVDRPGGRIWLPMTWNLGSDTERTIMEGSSEQPRRVFVTHSGDDGLTWAEPEDISSSARREHWRWYATGPGNSIQLRRGDHAGRIVVPCNHSDHSDPDRHPYRSHVIYLDPGDHEWRIGAVHQPKTNESAIAEMFDGTLLQAMRSYHGTNRRALAWSSDSGESFSPLTLADELDTPVCQGSLLALADRRVAFCSPKGRQRSHLTVWFSGDSGASWPVQREIYAGPAAYSCMVALPDDRLGILYERDHYQSIVFETLAVPGADDAAPE